MKKVIVIICVLVMTSSMAYAGVLIDGKSYQIDTLYHATAGPGIMETHLDVRNNNYVAKFYIAKIDITNPYNDIRVLTAGDTVFGLLDIPRLAAAHDNAEVKQLVGINADFGKMGNYKVPSAGYVISDGELIGCGGGYAPDFSSYFHYDRANSGFSRRVEIITSIKLPRGVVIPNVYINKNRGENEAILYNKHQGKFTNTNEWGAECALKVVSSTDGIRVGATMLLEVVSAVDKSGNMAIPQDGYVLSCHGTAMQILQQLRVGDCIEVTSKVMYDGIECGKMPYQLVGGSPIILKNGQVDSARIDDADKHLAHLNNKEPRSSIGVSEDGNSIFFVVVDGRNVGVSQGIEAKTLAHFMRFFGCHNAMNCDGGGSSQFYVKGLYGQNGCRVRNYPVGGTYCRPVSNGIFAVTKTPYDNEITRIELREKKLELNTGDRYSPVVYGYNKYGVIVDYNIKDVKITIAPEVGSIVNGEFVAGSGKYNTDFTVTFRGMSYTIPMYINGGGIFISGMEEVAADSTPVVPEYYTIQGIKLNNPQNGQLVIVRRGTQYRKEFYNK
ncbi:MAG: phosphodiester glycosidase family protein [Muribaculaceae bacterium]|nr:phosphodiester glycosidase family protein [Muribaculaceae bacterium]